MHRNFECVDGQIIGGFHIIGHLFYEGRPQGRDLWADDEAELRVKANEAYQQIKDECGQAFEMIYPADAWELRIPDCV